ncbi:MAG: amidohydrolase [Desulfarculaceae bacterium]|nr:amidohydrolase [Desulfarculaceae bacterium]
MDKAFQAWLRDLREDLHRHPELSGQEERTTRVIQAELARWGVELLPLPGMTGAVGLIRGTQPGPTLALRADIDALPIAEANEVPYRSQNPGVMHACGHDGHTAIMLGVARRVMESGLKSRLKGNIKFLFQPAEETGQGARMMLERGVLDSPRVDYILAAHLTADLPAGQAGITPGVSHSSCDVFHLEIRGQGAHGGRPHLAKDPIVAGAHLVSALQSIVARNLNPLESGAISVGEFVAGSANNIIPGAARLSGSLRALSAPARALLKERLAQMTAGLEKSFNVECHLELEETFPPLDNHPEALELLAEAAREALGAENVMPLDPVTAAEDFALFLAERPGALIRLGCAPAGPYRAMHSHTFDLDPQALITGVKVFVAAARRYLAPGETTSS